MAKAPRRCPRLGAAEGFTLIETLIASVVLIVGVLGAFGLLDVAARAIAATRAREGATNLAREILEDSRAIPFSEVSSNIGERLQQLPALAPKPGATEWQIGRRGYAYSVTVEACSIDDPKDGLGPHDSTFCPNQEQGTVDAKPIDLKRVSAKVTWVAQKRTHEVKQIATLSSAGNELGLNVSGLKLISTTPTTTITEPAAPTITSPSVTTLTFSVSAPQLATAVKWSLDGVTQSTAAEQKSGTTEWTFSWTTSGTSDGTYDVGAQAEQANGVIGPAVSIPVKLIRSVPAAPSEVMGGFNNVYVGTESTKSRVAELQWQANSERNVVGYRVYNPAGKEVCPGSPTTLSLALSCIDFHPPEMTASNLTYSVVALYRDSSGAVAEGPATKFTLVGGASNTYTLAPSTGNTGTNCEKFAKKDMLLGYTPASDTLASSSVVFCSNPFASGETVMFGGTLTAYLANESTKPCSLKGELLLNGKVTGPAPVEAELAAKSGVKAVDFPFSSTGLIEPGAGGRLEVVLIWGTGCSAETKLHYGASTYPSFFRTTPTAILATPNPPASLTVTSESNGTARLTWPAPSSGGPVSFFRIYRDGKLYSSRWDTAAATQTSDTDKEHSSAHTYYITAVNSSMTESEFVGPVTG